MATAAAAAACGNREPDAASSAAKDRPTAVSSIDELLTYAFAKTRTPEATHTIASIAIRYVRPDGSLDAEYGEVEIETAVRRRPPTPPPDDPARPVGAPVPHRDQMMDEMMTTMLARCPTLRWRGRDVVESEGSCSMFAGDGLTRPRCTIPELLARAKAAGAPANALATIDLTSSMPIPGSTQWSYRVEDRPRGIDFVHMIADDCAPIVEAPPTR